MPSHIIVHSHYLRDRSKHGRKILVNSDHILYVKDSKDGGYFTSISDAKGERAFLIIQEGPEEIQSLIEGKRVKGKRKKLPKVFHHKEE